MYMYEYILHSIEIVWATGLALDEDMDITQGYGLDE